MSQNLEKLIGKLQQLKPDIDAIEVADVLWLSQYISLKEESFEEEEITPKNPSPKNRENKNDIDELEDEYDTITEIEEDDIDEEENDYSFNPNHAECHNIVSLQNPPKKQIFNLGLARQLKPLKRKVASKRKMELDIESTIDFIADAKIDVYQAILKPKEEKEFSLSVIIDKGDSMFLWNDIVEDFIKNITTYGIFSKINFYYLSTDEKRASLYADNQLSTIKNHKTIELNHRNNIIFILTDCVSLAWRSNSVYDEFINFWTKSSFVSIVQMLPQSMWKRTSLHNGYQVNFSSRSPYSPLNKMLNIDLELIQRRTNQDTLKIPVLSFDNYSFEYLSKIITSTPNIWVNGIAINNFHFKILAEESEEMNAKERVDYFFSVASSEAQKLAIYCSVLPLTIEIIKEVQKVQNLEQDMSYIAEFYFGKLLIKSEVLGDFDFYGGVRELLQVNLPATDAMDLLEKLSVFMKHSLGTTIGFKEILYENDSNEKLTDKERELITIFMKTLKRKGGKFLKLEKKIKLKIKKTIQHKVRFESLILKELYSLSKSYNITLSKNILLLNQLLKKNIFSIKDLENLLDSKFEFFLKEFNNFALVHQVSIKITRNITHNNNFILIEDKDEIYNNSQIESTNSFRDNEFITTKGKKKQIKLFVSYSREDAEYVDFLIKELEKTGLFDFWKDAEKLLLGEDFDDNIQKAIKECDIGLLMISKNFESDFIVKHELPHFVEMRGSHIKNTKTAIPVCIRTKKEMEELYYCKNLLAHTLEGKGYMEILKKDKFVKELSQKILDAIKEKQKKEERALKGLIKDEDRKTIENHFINSKANNLDVVSQIKKWSYPNYPKRYFALLGDSGMGKTWCCMKANLEISKDKNTLKSIYLDLRHYSSHIEANHNFRWKRIVKIILEKSLIEVNIESTITELFDIIHRGEAFIIFDGLDEVTIHLKNDNQVNEFIRELRKVVAIDKGNKVLFSCRTHYFRTIQEQFSLFIGKDREEVQRSDFESLELLPFTIDQIEVYCENRGLSFSKFMNTIKSIHNLEELSHQPYFLSLITQQIRNLEDLIDRGEEVNSSDIYMNMIEHSLNRDNGKHTLSKTDKQLIMRELSAYMWKNRIREISYPDLDEWFNQWLFDNPVVEKKYQHIPRVTLTADLRGATSIVRPYDNVFRFAHTSMQEFFLAWYLFNALKKDELYKFDMRVPSIETLEFFVMLWKKEEYQTIFSLLKNFNKLSSKLSNFTFEVLLVTNRLGLSINPDKTIIKNLNLFQRKILGEDDSYINFEGSTFRNIDFSKTDLKYVDLDNTTFINCIIKDSFWEKITLENAIFEECDINNWNIRNSNILDIKFVNSKLRNFKIFKCEYSSDIKRFISILIEKNQIKRELKEFKAMVDSDHRYSTRDVACSSDGKYFASASSDKSIKLYDTKSMELITAFTDHKDWIRHISFSPNDKFLASTSDDGHLHLYELEGFTKYKNFYSENNRALSLSFSSDSNLIAFTAYNEIKFYNLKTYRPRKPFISTDHCTNIAFNYNSKFFAYSSENILYLRDGKGKKEIAKFQDHKSLISALVFSPDGKYIATGSHDWTIKIYNLETKKLIHTFSKHINNISSLAFSADSSMLASVSNDTYIYIYDMKELKVIKNHKDKHSRAVHFSHDSRYLFFTSDNNSIKRWDLENDRIFMLTSDNKVAEVFEFNQQLQAEISKNRIKFYDREKKLIKSYAYTPRAIEIIFEGHNKFYASISHNVVTFYNIKTSKLVKTIYYFTKGSFAILDNKTGRFVYAVNDAWKYIHYMETMDDDFLTDNLPAEYFGDIEGLE